MLADQPALVQALQQFATRSVEDYDLDGVLQEVTEQARNVLGLDGAGLTLRVGRGQPTQYVTATDDTTLRVEREQDRLQEGVCIDAMSRREPVHVADIDAVEGWPDYRRVVLAAGFRGVAGIPMLAADRVVGALNAYVVEAREWAADDLHAARLLANVATAYIANASGYADQARLAAQLQHALDSRVVIEQAKGVLAERYGVTVDEAFEALRRHARSHRRNIHDVAVDVLAKRTTVQR